MPRIVSLLPSATEIVCALGMRASLVAVSHECDWPEGVQKLPALSRPRLDPAATSPVIDAQVREIVAQALSVYQVDAEKLQSLKPDIIITQTQCEVCAVSEDDVRNALAEWTGAKPEIVSLAPETLDGVSHSIRQAGNALNRENAAAQCLSDMRERFEAVRAKTATRRPVPTICLEWAEPPMSSGSWSPEITAIAGGRELLGQAGQKARYLSLREIAAAEPQAVLLTLCGFGIDRAARDLPALADNPTWKNIPAVRNNRLFICDGNHFFNRPGPRLAETAELLAEALHPGLFPHYHEGRNWIRAS